MVLRPVSGRGAQQYAPVPERASWGTEYALGAQNSLLGYRMGFHSEAFGVKNRLFWYGSDISVPETPFSSTEQTFVCAKQPPVVRDTFSGALGAQIIICC